MQDLLPSSFNYTLLERKLIMNKTELVIQSKHPPLSVSERLSIINELMAQDRIEIRERQEAVFRLTYLVVPESWQLLLFPVELTILPGISGFCIDSHPCNLSSFLFYVS